MASPMDGGVNTGMLNSMMQNSATSKGKFEIFKAFFGLDSETKGLFGSDTLFGNGFSLENLTGFGEMFGKARGDGFFGELFNMFEANPFENMMGGGILPGSGDPASGGGGEEDGGGGSAQAFSGIPPLGGQVDGGMQDVAPQLLGSLSPSATPGGRSSQGMGLGSDF